jgi:hypothetical protein
MGRVSTAAEVVMGSPQAISLALGAMLVSLISYHLIFLVMAIVITAAVAYLALMLRGQLLRPVPAVVEEVHSGSL